MGCPTLYQNPKKKGIPTKTLKNQNRPVAVQSDINVASKGKRKEGPSNAQKLLQEPPSAHHFSGETRTEYLAFSAKIDIADRIFIFIAVELQFRC